MDDQALHVCHVGQQRKDLQVIDESPRLLLTAFDLKGKDGSAAVGEVLFIQRVMGMVGQRGVVHLFNQRVLLQVQLQLELLQEEQPFRRLPRTS